MQNNNASPDSNPDRFRFTYDVKLCCEIEITTLDAFFDEYKLEAIFDKIDPLLKDTVADVAPEVTAIVLEIDDATGPLLLDDEEAEDDEF